MEIGRNTKKIRNLISTSKKRFINIKMINYNRFFDQSKVIFANILLNSSNIIKKYKNKNRLTYIGAGALGLLLIFLFNIVLSASMIAYEVKIEDKTLAIVRSQEDFNEAIDMLKDEVWIEYNKELAIPEDIIFEETKAKNSRLTGKSQIVRNLKAQLDFKVKAAAIFVNGQEVGIVSNAQLAMEILEEIKAPFKKQDGFYSEIGFSQNVEVVEVATDISSIKAKEDVKSFIVNGTDEEKVHKVQSGENSWVIAQKYNLSVEDIAKANPKIRPDRLQIGQEISLVVPRPYITVLTKEYVELVESVPFETQTVQSDNLYKGDKRITVQGVEGKREIKGYIVRENGVEVDREILHEKVLLAPKTRVVAEGTKPRPATVATGTFARPTRGRLTSGFGMRWGTRHNGIDIAAPTGTPITAADAGRVTFAGWQGNYGNLVIIDHENGYQTYYAHCSRLLVSAGQRVFKGQQIATVGSTGQSTGPHLHFEVRRNGVPINPSQFVSY